MKPDKVEVADIVMPNCFFSPGMEARRHKLLDLKASLKGHNTLKKSNLITSAVNQTCHYFRFYKKNDLQKSLSEDF